MKQFLTSITIAFTITCILIPAPARIIYVDAHAHAHGSGASWSDAFNYLSDALNIALPGAEIRVARGIYQPDQSPADPNGSDDRTATFQLLTGVAIRGGYAGVSHPQPDTRDITQFKTILSGDLHNNDVTNWNIADLLNEPNRIENTYHIITGNYLEPNAILDGFTITGGQADGGAWPHDNGAGYFADVGSPTLINCTFERNAARFFGGGIFNQYSNPTLTNCTFQYNSAKNGGGMQNKNSSPTLDSCTFNNNYAADQGGALRNHTNSNAKVTYCTFSDNRALFGGGIYNYASEPDIIQCTLNNNSANSGGGIYNYFNSNPTITHCLFTGNTANFGGGINNYNDCEPTITYCTLTHNTAHNGAGIYNFDSSPSITNTIIWYNPPQEIYSLGGAPVITYCNIQGGSAGLGNLDKPPLFADKYLHDHQTPDDPNDDYYVVTDHHLQSTAGRWDPNRQSWIYDPNTSPAIDTGSPGFPLLDEPNDPTHNLRVNMGVYGATNQASYTPPAFSLLADMTNDGMVNAIDYTYLARDWRKTQNHTPPDLNRNGVIDLHDLALLIADWLKTTSWY